MYVDTANQQLEFVQFRFSFQVTPIRGSPLNPSVSYCRDVMVGEGGLMEVWNLGTMMPRDASFLDGCTMYASLLYRNSRGTLLPAF